jgi:MarR family transcriptional regulator, organic hydroperoxide resistance regulator
VTTSRAGHDRPAPVARDAGGAEVETLAARLKAVERIHARLLRTQATALPTALTPPQARVLGLLLEVAREGGQPDDGLPISGLAERLGLTHSTVSGIVDRLEKRQLVVRATRPDDRRFAWVKTTPTVDGWGAELPAIGTNPLVATLAEVEPTARQALSVGLDWLLPALERRLDHGGAQTL